MRAVRSLGAIAAALAVADNLYFVGSSFVSAWVLKTSDGLILIDALNNALEAQSLIEGGMRKLGLDPAQIKYVIITHGHGDHYGGAPMLVQKYGTRVVASESDWKMMETGLEFDSPFWGRPPKRDIAIALCHARPYPGDHLARVRREGGWTQLQRRFSGVVPPSTSAGTWTGWVTMWRRFPIDVMLSNHPSWDDLVAKMAKLRVASSGAHPFVSGREVVGRSLRVMEECARAQQHRFRVKPRSRVIQN